MPHPGDHRPGPKGGSGKTTMATNLAVGLAHGRRGGSRSSTSTSSSVTCASDAASPRPHVRRRGPTPRDFDATTLKVFLTPHHAACRALCTPSRPMPTTSSPPTRNESSTLSAESSPSSSSHTVSGLDEAALVAARALDRPGAHLLPADVPSVAARARSIDAARAAREPCAPLALRAQPSRCPELGLRCQRHRAVPWARASTSRYPASRRCRLAERGTADSRGGPSLGAVSRRSSCSLTAFAAPPRLVESRVAVSGGFLPKSKSR